MTRGYCLFATIMMICLCSCTKTYYGEDELIKKAREEINLSDIENTDITIAGSVDVDEQRLVWFVTGNEYEAHGYYPMEFNVGKSDSDGYEFIQAYYAIDRGTDIVSYPWNGYVFLINNPSCEKLVLTYEGRREEIQVSEKLPFIYRTDQQESLKYEFIDANGNEIR